MHPAEHQCDVAIIGAGPAGLAAGRALLERGRSIRLFDKGRGPGGRLSTRRAGTLRFDHGARALDFPEGSEAATLERWRARGAAARWSPRLGGDQAPREHWVGVPGMNAVVRAEAEELEPTFGSRITRLDRTPEGWALVDLEGTVACRAPEVVVAVPAPQAQALLEPTGFRHLDAIANVVLDPVWAFMFEGPDRSALGFDVLERPSPVIEYLEAQASKPGRAEDRAWVAHATVAWSRAHLEDERESVEQVLGEEVARLLDHPVAPPWSAHRWRYGLVRTPAGAPCLRDDSLGLVACGDWCLGPAVEHALASGRAAGSG